MRFLNFGGGQRKFFARDFRNAYQFRPDIAPPRQKFQGYVNFIINRDVKELGLYASGEQFRTRISSLVKTATLPDISFRSEIKNKYNRKKIVQTGLDYGPVSFTVHDTIQNEWLTLFMRYYSHLYMNPRNKFKSDTDRDPISFFRSSSEYNESKHAGKSTGVFDSNAFGFNVSETANFFERIDFILYHGNKGVQYSITNPVMNRIRFSDIDYGSSEIMDFQMEFDFENFVVARELNFDLAEQDLNRFEEIDDPKNLPGFYAGAKIPVALEKSVILDTTGKAEVGRERSFQVLSDMKTQIEDTIPGSNLESTYSEYTPPASSGGFLSGIQDFLEDNPFGRIIDRAIGAKINGQDPKEAAGNALTDEIVSSVNVNRWTNKTGQSSGDADPPNITFGS